MARDGVFITIEGGEGAGKSTLIQSLGRKIEGAGRPVVLTREPGGSPDAEAIRSLALAGADDRWDPVEEVLLMNAARRNHWRITVAPALAKGAVVLCDRFRDSTYAYQATAGRDVLDAIDAAAAPFGGWVPDRTLILDLPAEVGLQRVAARKAVETRFDARALAFHERIRASLLATAAAEPDRCVVVDASQDQDSVLAASWSALSPLIAEARA